MSFCRFSSHDFRCDFYAYESLHGFELHVAALRVEWDPPPSPLTNLQLPPDEWQDLYHRYHQAYNAAPKHRIDHPEAGSCHTLPSLQDLRDKIADLVSQGFQAPPLLLADLDHQILDEAHPAP